jgi:hypothetical protein
MRHEKCATTDITTPTVNDVAQLHPVATKCVSCLFGDARDAVCSDAETDEVFRHNDGNTFVRIISLVQLTAEWSGLYAVSISANVGEVSTVPALGDISAEGGDERNCFVSGEAEIDEPLAVERAGHLFQNLDASLVVFDQIVVSRQDSRDSALKLKRRHRHLKIAQNI